MKSLQYEPYQEVFNDLIVIVNPVEEKIDKILTLNLGFYKIVKKTYTLYSKKIILEDISFYFQGIGIVDNKFLIGSNILSNKPKNLGAGSYAVFEINDESIIIHTDTFSMHAMYFSKTFVTNRLHLAAIIQKGIDYSSAFALTAFDSMICYQLPVFRTPVEGVKLVRAFQSIAIDKDGLKIYELEEINYDDCDPYEYHKLIQLGAEEICSNVEAIINSGMEQSFDISGGLDSRIVFAAVVATGNMKKVTFNTKVDYNQKDLAIATGLVSKFGGRFRSPESNYSYVYYDTDDLLNSYRSFMFGTYHWLYQGFLRPKVIIYNIPFLRVMGGNGEIYRNYYTNHFFTAPDKDEFNLQLIPQILKNHYSKLYGANFEDIFLKSFIDTFSEMPGKSFGHKFDDLYLNFRNRFHFGNKPMIPQASMVISPSASRNLFKASRRIPRHFRDDHRVIFDVIRCMCHELAYYPYDDQRKNFINTDNPYHIKSKYDNIILDLQPNLNLVKISHNNNKLLKPISPTKIKELDYNNYLLNILKESFDIISSEKNKLSDLITDNLKKEIDLCYANNKHERLSCFASKFLFFSDLLNLNL